MVVAAPPRIARAVAGPPVNVIMSTPECETSTCPAFVPVTTFTTPGGSRSSIMRRKRSTLAEAYSDGFTTTVQPTASAGAILFASVMSGEFQERTAATTPTGSRYV
ncbi:unannotated protein [freshwater metagenome]|uniref:Unannotated protein n=1 Tax=freshwater metagenome TaxID=449393 RepID=A0A6J6UZA7_9ZZZZ